MSVGLPVKATSRVPSALIVLVPARVPLLAPVMVTAGTGSPRVYPEPIPVRFGTPATPLATLTVTLFVSVGAPVKVTLRVPSTLIVLVPARVPLLAPVTVTVGAVSVGS